MNKFWYILILACVIVAAVVLRYLFNIFWIAIVDTVVGFFKKIFKIEDKNEIKNWHSIEDIKNKKEESEN